VILRELEARTGLIKALAGCFVDLRDKRFVEHSVESLVAQRLYGIVLGYEDLNDHDQLRRDPVHGLIAGKSDPLGQDRRLDRDKGRALAGHATLNRLELSARETSQFRKACYLRASHCAGQLLAKNESFAKIKLFFSRRSSQI